MDNEDPPEWLQQVARNVDALIRSSWPIIRAAQEAMEQVRAPQIRDQRHRSGSSHLSATATLVAMGEVAGATSTLTVSVEDESGSISTLPVDIVALARLLLFLIALILPLAETRLSQEEHQILSDYIATFGVWLPIELLLRAKRKR